jgi:S-adenosylmethionine:tRNA ribosyltransferase-isomerase
VQTEKLTYHLPRELIAQQPLGRRTDSRLLVLNRSGNTYIDSRFSEIGRYINPGDCLVLNDTRVIPARFFVHRATGAEIEGLFLSQDAPGLWRVMLKNARRIRPGETIYLTNAANQDFCPAKVLERKTSKGTIEEPESPQWLLKIDYPANAGKILSQIGLAPLPPYIKRGKDTSQAQKDLRRYQTVYAKKDGAVAAPTAGLHFTNKLLEQLKDKGIRFACITLHVGAGTFRPITAKTLEEHNMESEYFSLDEHNARIINETRRRQGRIIAVGTTSIRTLETTSKTSMVKTQHGKTNLFIKPGYKFKMVDAMITNFHLPKSSLLALVAAFAGLENVLAAYHHAIERQYRFYSYGDAMLII